MRDAAEIPMPKYFRLVRRLCIVLNSLGVFGSVVMILLAFTPSSNQFFASIIEPLPMNILYLIISLIGLSAVVWFFKLGGLGRWLILICTGLDALNFVYRTLFIQLKNQH